MKEERYEGDDPMTLAGMLHIQPGVTAVIGSGGKTSLLRALGDELSAGGGRVLLCTTTKFLPFPGLINLLGPSLSELKEQAAIHPLLCAGTPEESSGKLSALSLPLGETAALFDYVLVEADGAHRRPLKAHAPHEPVIPPEARQTICVVGLSGIGQPIARAAHRPTLFARLAGREESDEATVEAVAQVLKEERLADWYVLNQTDIPQGPLRARRLAAALGAPAVAGSIQKGEYFTCSL